MKIFLYRVSLTMGTLLASSSHTLGQVDSSRAGEYVWSAEGGTLRPCGSDSVFGVLASPSVLDVLGRGYRMLTTKPHEPIYVRVRGNRSPEKPRGFVERYNGFFRITSLVEARRQWRRGGGKRDRGAPETR